MGKTVPTPGARLTRFSAPGRTRPPVPRRARKRGPPSAGAASAAEQAGGEVALDLVQGDALLLHRVALADGDRVVVQGVEVDGDAERRTDLVLAAVAAADGTGVVELDVPVLPEVGGEALGLRRELRVAGEREDRDLDRRQARVEAHHGALLHDALGVRRLVLAVRVEEEGQHRAADTGCRFD